MPPKQWWSRKEIKLYKNYHNNDLSFTCLKKINNCKIVIYLKQKV